MLPDTKETAAWVRGVLQDVASSLRERAPEAPAQSDPRSGMRRYLDGARNAPTPDPSDETLVLSGVDALRAFLKQRGVQVDGASTTASGDAPKRTRARRRRRRAAKDGDE